PIKAKTLKYQFKNIPKGHYAIALFHDQNGNGELDYNIFGIPTEGYAFSNNPKVLGEPNFEDAKFKLTNNIQITMEVK
ncbi:MAG: DUF2141 domain-containing protein, partial [Campylobacterota bacterium]|nr:DUF2141 domain-containing protein [Campylobacterota bacterium]